MSTSLKFTPLITNSVKLTNLRFLSGQFIVNITDGSTYLDFTVNNEDQRIQLFNPLVPATVSTLGGVKIGTGINVSSDGTISVSSQSLQPATSSTLGGVKIGSGVNVSSDGTISVSTYSLPVATTQILGGVKIGAGINVSSEGTISVSTYSLPIATSQVLGGVKIGTGISISNDGTISIDANSIQITGLEDYFSSNNLSDILQEIGATLADVLKLEGIVNRS